MFFKQKSPKREPARSTHRLAPDRVLFAVLNLLVVTLALGCARIIARNLRSRLTGVVLYTRVRAGRLRVASAVVVAVAVALMAYGLLRPATAHATNSSTNTINFQARLETASGGIAADGNYNVEFKLYNTASGGTALWTEDYLVSNSQGIRTANGYLTANLGSVTAFPNTINWGQQLYITMNIGGTGSSASWDGEMNPRLSLTSVPSAFSLTTPASATGYTSSLNLLQPTGGNQTFQIQDQGAAGTYNLCVSGSTTCGFAPTTGGTGYIQNQNSAQQTASNFWVSGTGRADTALQAPSFDTATGTGLNIGATNATSITLGKTGVNTIVAGNLSIGTTSSYGAITLANGAWITSVGGTAGTSVNMFSVNSNNEIQVGASLDVDGGILMPLDAGQVTLSDLPIDSSAAAGTPESYTLRVGSSNVLTVYGESDGAGNEQNSRVAIGSSITPAYTLDVGGDINTSTQYRIGGTAGVSQAACTAGQVFSPTTSGGIVTGGSCTSVVSGSSSNFIQNQTAAAQGAGFWIQSASSSTAGATIQAATGQTTGAVLQVLNASGTQVFSVLPTGFITTGGIAATGGAQSYFGGAAVSNTILTINTNTASKTALVLKGSASQSADLFQAQNSDGTNLVTINSSGFLTVPSIGVGTSPVTGIKAIIVSGGTSTITQVNRGIASQTADLFQMQNSSAAVLGGFNASGQLYYQSGSYTGTLQQGTLSANQTYTLPNESGTICLQNSANCGFLTASTANSNYIQNQNSAAQTSSNFWISGSGQATSFLTSTVDTPSGSTTLNIGTTNATTVNIGASGGTTTTNLTGPVSINGSSAKLMIGTATGAAKLTVVSGTAATVTQVNKLTSGQTADLFETQDSSGNILSRINSSGSYGIGADPTGVARFVVNATSTRAEVIQMGSANTADALQIQNSSSTVLSGLNSNGQLYYHNGSNNGTIVSGTLSGDQTYTLPNATGTFVLNGAATLTTNGVLYGTSAGTTTGVAGTAGQILQANASGTPAFVTVSGDVSLANGGAISLSKLQGQTLTLSSATSGQYLRYNGTAWVNSAIQAGDLPDISGSYIKNQTASAQTGGFWVSGNGTVGGSLTVSGGATITGNTSVATTAGNTLSLGNSTGALTVTGNSASTFVINGVTVTAAEFNLLDGHDAALVDTNDAVHTAITGTGALNSGSIATGFGTITTGNTITGTTLNGTTGINTGTGTGTQRIDANGNVTANNVSAGGTLNVSGMSTLRGVTVNTATATQDQIVLQAAATGTARFTGTLTNADLTANQTYTLPNATGTFVLSSAALTANGVLYGNASGTTTQVTGTSGQMLQANATGTPTFVSLSGDATIAVGGAVSIAKLQGQTLTLSSATSGQYLRYNGTAWVNSALQASDLPDLGTAYIKNQTAQQASANFNISGSGTIGNGLTVSAGGATIAGNTTIATTAGNTLSLGNSTGALTVTGSSASVFVLNGVTVSAAEFNLLDGHDTALVDTNDAVNTAITGTGALNSGTITSGFGTINNGDTITGTVINGTTGINTGTGTGTQRIDANGNVTANNISAGGTLNVSGASTLRGVTVNTATATQDQITLQAAATGTARFTGTITNADLTANQTYTLPNATGTFVLSNGALTANGVLYGTASGTTAGVTGTAGQILQANASGVPTFVTASGDATLATGGALSIAKLQGETLTLTAATSGQYLRYNGTAWVNSAIQASDVPDLSASYIKNTTTQQASANFNISGAGTIGGNATIGGTLSVTGAATTGTSLNIGQTANQHISFTAGATNHGIEIGRTDGTSSTPFVDFHSGTTSDDYDSRIIASGGNGTNGQGTLNLTAATTNLSGQLQTGSTTRLTAAGVLQNVTYNGSTIGVGYGGTGTATAPTQGGVIYGASATAYGSTAAGTAGQCLISNGTAAPSWTNCAAGVAFSGSTNYVTRWTSASTIGTGAIYDDGTHVGIGTTTNTTYALQVAGTARVTSSLTVNADLTADSLTVNNLAQFNDEVDVDGPVAAGGTLTANGLITGYSGLGVYGTVNLNTSNSGTTNIGTGTTAHQVNIGGSATTLAITSQGGLNVTSAGVVTAGTYNGQTISAAASFTGTLAVATLGTANTSTLVCRNSSNQLAGCKTTGAGAPYVEGGNSFGATAVLGTSDNYGLQFNTNGSAALTLGTDNTANFLGAIQESGTTVLTAARVLQNVTADAGIITTGTLADARLSTNVALYNRATSNFTGTLQQNGSNVCTAAGNCSTVNSTMVATDQFFKQGGNSMSTSVVAAGSPYTLGSTNDGNNHPLDLITNGTSRLAIDTTGNVNVQTGSLQISGTAVLNQSRALSNLTGITSSGTITFSGLGNGIVTSTAGVLGVTASPLGIAQGGTGATTLTAGGILFGNGTGAITASAVLGNGQLLIGDGSGAPTAATLTQGANMAITNAAGSITVATVQNPNFTTSVTTPLLTSTGTLSITAGGALNVKSATTNAASFDSGTTGAVNIGTGANAKTITVGNTTGTTALNLTAGSGGINLSGTTSAVGTLNLNTTGSSAINLGNANTPLVINSTTMDLSSAGVVSGLTGITSSGTITFSGLGTGLVTANAGVLGVTASPLGIAQGGTGATNLTAGGILIGGGTGAITATGVLGNGQLLIGDASGAPTAATLTQGANIAITNAAGSITVATTQNPTFTTSVTTPSLTSTAGMTITAGGALNAKSTTTNAASFDSGTTGAVNIGTGAYAKTVTVGSTTGASVLNLHYGTGGLQVNSTTILNSARALSNLTAITSSGTITFSGLSTAGIVTNTAAGVLGTVASLSVAQGGTGATSLTDHAVLLGSGTGALTPLAPGTTGYCLQSSGTSADPIWASCAASTGGTGYIQNQNATAQAGTFWINGDAQAATFTGSGANLTALNANNISTGTVADARLSTNVALYNRTTSNFTGTLQHNGNNVCDTSANCVSLGDANAYFKQGGSSTMTGATTSFNLGSTSNANLTVITNNIARLTVYGTASGNAAVGDVNIANNLLTGGTSRLTSAGILQNVTYQGGVINVAYGGTGTATAPTAGGIIYGASTSAYGSTVAGTAGQCLTSNGASAPTWTNCASGSTSGSFIQNGTAAQSAATFNIQSGATGNVTAKIRALASQTGDLLEVRNSGDTASYLAVSSAGLVTASAGMTAYGALNLNSGANTPGTTNIGASTTATAATVNIGTGGTATHSVNIGNNVSASKLIVTMGNLDIDTNGNVSAGGTLNAVGAITTSTATATQDQLRLLAASTGSARFLGTITNADLTAARTYTLPDASGTVLLDTVADVNYIQNGTAVQTADFNVSGTGTIGGTLTVGGTATFNGTANFVGGTFHVGSASTTQPIYLNSEDTGGTSAIYIGNTSTPLTINSSALKVTSSGVVSGATGITTSGVVNVNSATAGKDTIRTQVYTGGATNSYVGTLTNADLTAARTWTLPDVTGTFITTGNLTSITSVGTISSGTWNGGVIGVGYGGTGATTLTSNGVLYGNGTGTIQATAASTGAQCLISASAGAAPTWGSCATGNGITGTGTANNIAMFTGSGVIANSILTQSGTTGITVGGTLTVTGLATFSAGMTANGALNLNTTGTGATNIGTTSSANAVTIGTSNTTLAITSSGFKTTSAGAVTGVSTLNASGAITSSSTIQGTQLKSTVANGTAPLTVVSSTLVANLNADLLDGHDSSYFATASAAFIQGGNSFGTTAILGTNDNNNLQFETNNVARMIISSGTNVITFNNTSGTDVAELRTPNNNNIWLGYQAGASYTSGSGNTALGGYALQASTTGAYNTAIGLSAMQNGGGTYNIAVGPYTLQHTTGGYNSALGYYTMNANTTGSYNTSIGNDSLESNTTGSYNTALGSSAMSEITTGTNNVAIGYQSLEANESDGSDSYNAVVGVRAGSNADEVNYSSLLGYGAGGGGGDLDRDVILGYQAGYSAGSGNVMIGYQAGYNESGNNKLYIANSNTSTPLIQGDFNAATLLINGSQAITGNLLVGATTTSDNARLHVEATIGTTWTQQTSVGSGYWESVAYGNGTFVAVGTSGTIMTSTNGTSWTNQTAVSGNWGGLVYANSLFVAVGINGAIMTSPDGVTWTVRTAVGTNTWQDITYGNGTFVAVGSSGTIMTSTNGTSWTARTAVGTGSWYGVTYGNGTFVAVGSSGTIMTSTNGTSWTARTAVGTGSWESVAYGNGTFVAVGTSGTVMTSTNGITWTSSTVSSVQWMSIVYTGTTFAAVSSGTVSMTSTDGITWTTHTTPSSTWYGITYANGLLVAVGGSGGTIMTSAADAALSVIGSSQFSGSVGIGMSPATGRALQVGDNGVLGVSGTNARLQLSPNGNGTTNLWNLDNNGGTLRMFTENYTTTGTGGGGVVQLTISSAGNVGANGNITANAFDLAERYGSTSDLDAGTIVSIDTNNSQWVTAAHSSSDFIGVVSTNPGLILGQDYNAELDGAPYKPIVALGGRVPVKVSTKNGPIMNGDPITLSADMPGVGVKATHAGKIVGYAMSDYTNTDPNAIGSVTIFVQTGYWEPSSLDLLQANSMVANNLQVSGTASIANLNVSGTATMNNLKVTGNATMNNLTVNGGLTVNGLASVQTLQINGHIITRGNAPAITLGQALGQALADATSAPVASVDGTDTTGTISVTAGGQQDQNGVLAQITFAQAFDAGTTYKAVISASNDNATDLRIYVQKTATGFNIVSRDAPTPGRQYQFDYIVMGAQAAAAP